MLAHMEKIKQCRNCGFRKLLVIREVNQVNDSYPTGLDVWAGRKPEVRLGKFRVVVCCRCGHTHWTAYDLGEIMQRLGELHPHVELVDGDLWDALAELGFTEMPGASFAGWKRMAEGSREDVPLMVGEGIHLRNTREGYRNVLCVEIRAKARSVLGNFSVRHFRAPGLDPGVAYTYPVKTGDGPFDMAFSTTRTGQPDPEMTPLVENFQVPVVKIPWLDASMRELFKVALPYEVFVFGNNLVILLPQYDPQTFPAALDLAVQLARWSGPSEHPYR